MSRFTRAPFHKPSPFDIPRPVHPLSPPDTDITADSLQLPPMNIVSRDMGSYGDFSASASYTRVDTPENYQSAASDAQTPNGRFRRPSNLAYLHPGSLRGDLRAPRSATRWLVMVIPPPAISREHGNGVFLNASARTAHGVLLPLLPSLSGQLSAIAREFAFPSTSGICIFLQMAEAGIQLTPRISDESWSILWGSAFDERHTMNTMGGLPIAGRIEFDLDLRKARWFDMWLTSLKNAVDLGPSAPVSLAANHRREESRTTYDHVEDSTADDISVTIQRKVPVVRHVPRKLSLLDRVDVSTLKPISRPTSRIALSPTDAEQPRVVLSPVAQTPIAVPVAVDEDEPQTAIQRVEKKVQSWRASSSFAKSPFVTSTGQTALDPANMPNNQPLIDSFAVAAAEGPEPLNLDDFTWSISSTGPLSADFDVPTSHYSDVQRPPSVHLDGRLEGSVCLTPTTCTSFGPPEYDIFSPLASLISRLPSPDIAARQLEDSPPTPSTATSWGAPSEWPESPASIFRAPSVDLAARQLESRPVTPSTATSWGAPLEWPDSPAPRFRAPSVDLGARHLESRPVTPSTATSWGAPVDWPASPATPFYVHTPGVGDMYFDDEGEQSALLDHGRIIRSYGAGDEEPQRSLDEDADAAQISRPWRFVWPYRQASTANWQQPVSVHLGSAYPCINLYPAVYPHFDLYPASSASKIAGDKQPPRKRVPPFNSGVPQPCKALPWSHVWPYKKIVDDVVRAINTRLESVYPSIDLYPAVYPYFDLYPLRPLASGTTREVDIKLESRYPIFSIYTAVYPCFEIYPGHVVEAQRNPRESISVHLELAYPCIHLYPAVYPHFDLYPTSSVRSTTGDRRPPRKRASPHNAGVVQSCKASPWNHVWPYQRVVENVIRPVNTRLELTYPSINLYPAVYPHFDLYPTKPVASGTTREVSVKLEYRYPLFSIYTAIYPCFEIYPGHVVEAQKDQWELLSAKLYALYPSFEIYLPVYPHLVIYPGNVISGKRSEGGASRGTQGNTKVSLMSSRRQTVSVKLECSYPFFDIYPAGYPASLKDIYPRVAVEQGNVKEIDVKLPARYPHFNIYPAVYPSFDLYPTVHSNEQKVSKQPTNAKPLITVTLKSAYPYLEIYPPVYPHLCVYPSLPSPLFEKNVSTVCGARYPNLDIYPAVYPYFDIYRSGRPSTPEYWREAPRVVLDANYPVFDIYPPVYPFLDIYKTGFVSDLEPLTSNLSTRLEAKYPALDIYPAVYPNFELYPSIHPVMQTRILRHRARKTHRELVDFVLSQNNRTVPRVTAVPRISVSSHAMRRRPRRTHKELVELVFARPKKEFPRFRASVSFADVPQDVDDVNMPKSTRQSGIPLRPSDIRRSFSLGQATMSSSLGTSGNTGVARTRSLRQLPSVREESAGSRVGPQRLSQVAERKPPRRDSIVLEKARHWRAPGSKPAPQTADASRVTMNDLSDFPMPPLPPSSKFPSGRPTSAVNRPVAKLDKTKFPFR